MKKINFIITLIILLILSLNIIQAWADETMQTVYIKSAEDLQKLSKDCTIDRFSKGLNVVLANDIDLNGEAFKPIPIFLGTFDGNGHKIRGLSITVTGSNQGLFRYLHQGGIIRNLNVEGVVTPGGEKSNIGGIAGHNNGIIENCSFSGYVKGKDIVGGIAGWNGTLGMIIDSQSSGFIYGESKSGGIAGFNAGTILHCENESGVNTTLEESSVNFQDITKDMDDMDISKLSKLSIDVTDIGGIAGVNTGIVQNSQNKGIIGYPHVGYNIGGIAGRQSGYVTNCFNYGTINGRKEVGGIIGQMEPHISVLMSQSKLKRLNKELNTLQGYMTKMINDTKFTSNEMAQKVASIQGDIDNGKTHAQTLFNLTEQFINKDIEEINTLSVTAVEAMDKLLPITKALKHTAEIMEDSISPLQKSLRYLVSAMDEISEFTNQYDELSSTINFSIDKTKEAQDRIKDSNSNIKDALKLLSEGKTEGVLDLLKSSWNNLKKAKEALTLAVNNLKGIEDNISDMIESLGDMSSDMSKALNYMLDAIEIMTEAADDIDELLEGVNELLDYLAQLPPLEFATTDEEYQKTKESLYDSVSDMSNSFSDFINTMNVQGKIMMDDMQKVSDQLFLVIDLTFNVLDELINSDINDLENIVEDVSGINIDQKTEGKVSYCKNFGYIDGDLNVGGIAGAMSIEVKYDPEEDASIMENTSIGSVFQTSSIIHKCENNGKITAKKNHAGGIAGNMDLGYIKDCIAAGSVESTEGNYVGGIAGKSYGPIVSCYAKCTLSGADYVGGISGFGKEIINCYTLVKIIDSVACTGAIAGNIDKDNNIKTNYFVSDILGGIDGISYGDKAEPIDYDKLISMENIPPMFKEFQLSFLVDDKIINSFSFNYGAHVSQINLPNIPKKDGYYAKWEDFDAANITFDTIIHAIYTPYSSVLESKEKRNNTLSIILVEGNFTNKDTLTLVQNNEFFEIAKNSTELEQWNLIIPKDGNAVHTVRYLPPNGEKNLSVYIIKKGTWTKIDGRWDGQYLVFETDGNAIKFSILENKVSYVKYITISGAVLLPVLFVMVAREKRKASKNAAS